MLDYSKLRGRIVEKCGTQALFAKKMNLSERSICLKMQGKRMFKQNEIQKALKILELNVVDIPTYFFQEKVKKC